ncbi:biopolymer transporter ExbD [Crocinitomicaceae bacterium]|jgi:biopolymer transport protein ExbD|nr:biopolymer transporter ExbD [Crocinitomicaceae bacterium]MDB4340306.1 biopolymer transporter ExbD [Crocinitomicaceae bacterium]
MAKRDIPEINAGSMADIAFLLLLFFLVTTTMEKDTAYIRDIPKKVENPPEDIEIEERNILKIEANSANQLKVRDDYPEPDNISALIQNFYTSNEKENDLKSNYPLYSTATLIMCDVEYVKLEKEIEGIDEVADKIRYDYLVSAQDEWNKKREAIQLLSRETGLTELREIDKQAHIKIVVQKDTKYSIYTKIHNEIEEALNVLRNKKCKEIFNESYTHMRFRYNQNPDDNLEDKPKLDLIKVLYPGKIIEVEPKN